MTEAAVLFFYHLMIGATISLVVALIAASKTATQESLINDPFTGRARTVLKVDRWEFAKTWGLYTAAGTVVTLVILAVMETRRYLANNGYNV